MCQEFCRGLYFTAKFLQTNLWVYTLMIKGSFDVLMIVVLCIVRLISRIMGKSDICYGGKAWAFQSNMGGVGKAGSSATKESIEKAQRLFHVLVFFLQQLQW